MERVHHSAVVALRLGRQRLLHPVETKEEYEALFRLMQPVAPYYFSCPSDPPALSHRAEFDDRIVNDGLRAQRVIVKGRFQGGTVGYVYADELELFIGAYKKDIGALNERQSRIMQMLMSEGPLTCGILKDETGMLAKHIMPELHKLQEAFLVYEDQTDGDWDRGWYVFEREWDEVDINRFGKTEAVARLILRFLYLNAFATVESIKGWLRLPVKEIAAALEWLSARGDILVADDSGETGWIRAGDSAALASDDMSAVPGCVFSMHRADFLVKSQEAELKRRFAGLEVLQYVLVDGQFAGAVTGHWRQGPHDVEDIVLTLPEAARRERKREILDAVAKFYRAPFSFIRRYDGKELAVSAPADSNIE